VDDQVMNTHDTFTGQSKVPDILIQYLIHGTAQDGLYRFPDDVDAVPYHDTGYDQAGISVDIDPEEVEDSYRDDGDGTGDCVEERVHGSRPHGHILRSFIEIPVKEGQPKLNDDRKDQEDKQIWAHSEIGRVPYGIYGILEELKTDVRDNQGDDQSGNVFYPSVSEWVVLVRRFARKVGRNHVDDRGDGIGQVIEGISHNSGGSAEKTNQQLDCKQNGIA